MEAPPPLRLRRSLSDLDDHRLPEGMFWQAFRAQDARGVHALLALGYEAGGGEVEPFDVWWPALAADVEYDPALVFVVADARGEPAGVAQCWTSGFIKDVVVHPDHRGRGLAAALLGRALEAFAARGLVFAELKVRPDNAAAIRVYRRLDFVEAD